MLNLSPLFFTTVDDESCMHDELDLSPAQRAGIASAQSAASSSNCAVEVSR